MTGAVLDRTGSLFASGCECGELIGGTSGAELAEASARGRGITLEEVLSAALHAARTNGATECPVCHARMTPASGGAECAGCRSRLR